MANTAETRATRPAVRLASRVALVCILVASIYAGWLWYQVPDVAALRTGQAPISSFMHASFERAGVAPTPPAFTPLDNIPPFVACAVVKAEDVRFFVHDGVDWSQLWLAVRQRGHHGGASTITQQLARNLFLTPERSVHRKLREAFTAHRLETDLDKRRILELYLNVIQLGPGLWGLGAASERYFGVAPRDLTPFGAVFISALVAAPNASLAGSNLKRMTATARRVLAALYRSALIDGRDHAQTDASLIAMEAELHGGGTLQDALTAARKAPPSPPPPARALGEPLSDPFSHACGYHREIDEARQPTASSSRTSSRSPR